jgi:polysaccharide deacetylase family protein (PEP-CTERM system associated)
MSDLLFSVDLEDAGLGGAPLAALTGLYLDFLERHGAHATFFTVGDVARAHPALIRRIAEAGHEIACHSDRHLPLDDQGPASFRDDLRRNMEALHAAGAGEIRGYRAPFFSLVERTRWAYEILAELGFLYSSSVLPGRSPLYGWLGFGDEPRTIHGVLELPVTLLPFPWLGLPMAGGVYFRVLPEWLLAKAWRERRRRGGSIAGYFHPYDLDAEADWSAFPGYRRWSPGNFLLHLNRNRVLSRLERLAAAGFDIRPYRDFAADFADGDTDARRL